MNSKIVLFFFICSFFRLLNAQSVNLLRPEKWAQQLKSENLRNVFILSDSVYRSEQPDDKGFVELSNRGIVSSLNLREDYTDEKAARITKLKLYHISMEAQDIKDEDVIKALNLIQKVEKPILIHCKHGADRTGLICAMYRIIYQGWSKQEAINEMVEGGFGFHSVFKNIPLYIENVDIEAIKSNLER